MKLFDEMEKCFPVTEKHWDGMIEALGDIYLTDKVIKTVEAVLEEWLMENRLQPDSELHALFVQAGVTRERQMASLIVEWMHRARKVEGRPYINQRGSFPALW